MTPKELCKRKMLYAIKLKPDLKPADWCEITGKGLSWYYAVKSVTSNQVAKVAEVELIRIANYFGWDTSWVRSRYVYPTIKDIEVELPKQINKDNLLTSRCLKAIDILANKNEISTKEQAKRLGLKPIIINKVYEGDISSFIEFANAVSEKGIDYAYLTGKSDEPFYRGHISKSISTMASEINRLNNLIRDLSAEVSTIKTILKNS